MRDEPEEKSSGREPNPFVLPAETDGRFRMLIVTAVIVVWSLGSQITAPVSPFGALKHFGPDFRAKVAAGADRAAAGQIDRALPSKEDALIFARSEDFRIGREILAGWWQSFAMSARLAFVFFVLAALIYNLFPFFYRRRYRIEPLDAAAAPQVAAEIAGAARSAGLKEDLSILLKQGLLDGLAYRQWLRPVLVVAGDPKNIGRIWSDLHRSVALHELGHLVNGDIRKREIARALWMSLGVVVSIGFLLFVARQQPSAAEIIFFLWRTFGALLLAWILWGGLVRAREFYADFRVVTWGFGPALARRLSLPGVSAATRRFGLSFLLKMHPSNAERLRIVRDPAWLFRTSPLLAAVTGALLGLATGNVGALASDFVGVVGVAGGVVAASSGSWPSFLLPLIFILPPILLVVAARWITDALGIQVLRSALLGADRDKLATWGYSRLAILALAFTGGLEGGLALTPAAFFGWQGGSFALVWLAGFFLLIWIWLIEVRALGRLMLGACGSEKSKSVAASLLRWLASFQLAAFFLPALAWRFAAHVRTFPDALPFFSAEGGKQGESLGIFLVSSAIFLAFAVFFFALIGIALLVGSAFRIRWRQVLCPGCGRSHQVWRSVGRTCPCGENLSSWFYRPKNGYRRLVENGEQ